jgi:hypothetical protein
MSETVTFTIIATRDVNAAVWSGYCDAIPVAADAPTRDALLDKMREMVIDVLSDNRPELGANQITLELRG